MFKERLCSASRCLILLVCLLQLGCAASGPMFQPASAPNSNDALIYVYRPSALALRARTAHFYLNGSPIADLSNNGYTWLRLPKGDYTFSHDWGAGFKNDVVKQSVKVEPGQTYFLRLGSRTRYHAASDGRDLAEHDSSKGVLDKTGVNFDLLWDLTVVPWSEAQRDISECRYQAIRLDR